MKEFKGWEIAKMICEGELKHGDMIKNENGDLLKVFHHHLRSKDDNFNKELGSSYLGADYSFYTIVQKPVDLIEAWQSYLNGKIIESLETGDKYMKGETHMLILRKTQEDKGYTNCSTIFPSELEGKWTIHNRE